MTEKQFLEQTHYVEDRFDLVPAVDAEQRRARQIAQIGQKLDKLTGLMAGQVLRDNARRRSRRLEPPMTSGSNLSIDQIQAQLRREQDARFTKQCADAKAAYDAKNPHKNGLAARLNGLAAQGG